MRKAIAVFVFLGSIGIAPAGAQVFDMGSLTATLSVDHVTQSERARASDPDGDAEASRKAKHNCTQVLPALKQRSNDPRLAQIEALCRQLGHIK